MMKMKRTLISALVLLLAGWCNADAKCEDGSRLWLRLDTTNAVKAITGVKGTAMTELQTYWKGGPVTLKRQKGIANDGYTIAEDCIYKINGSVKLVDSAFLRPHPYLEGDMIVQSVGVKCAEQEAELKVTLSPKSYIYDGTRKKPAVTVRNGKTVLKKGRDYTVAYENNLNAGTARAIITLKGKYSGTAVADYKIRKADQEIQVTAKTGTVKHRDVRKKAQKIPDLIAVTGAKGKITYAVVSGPEYFSIGQKTGIVTVRKDTPKGTYKINVKVTVKGTKNYLKNSQTVPVKIRVK